MKIGKMLSPGAVIEVEYPFVRQSEEDGGDKELLDASKPWRPGTRAAQVSNDDFDLVADGMGKMVLVIVSTHKPGRFPTRVFFTRSWVDPDGKAFGKPKLRTSGQAAFTRICKGYLHRFEIAALEGNTQPAGFIAPAPKLLEA